MLAYCGRATDTSSKDKAASGSGIKSPDDASLQPAGAPPSYVSNTPVNPTEIEITLTAELTDASATNPSNFLFNNGLQAVSIAKKSGAPATLVITTTVQQQISYVVTMLNLTGTNGVTITGVIQVTFTGLPSPNIILVDWRDPTTTTALPAALGPITLCVPAQVSGASCVNAPFYNRASTYGILNAPNAVAYKYKVDAGAWSAEIPIATPLNATGLADGYHTFYIIGKHSAGYWQATGASDVYVKSWVQDTTPPTALFDTLTLPASITASQTFNVRAVGTDVSYFRYCLTNGSVTDCSTSTFVGSPDSAASFWSLPNAVYTNVLTPGNATIKVIGFDASGNGQAAPVAGGTYSFQIDTGAVEAVFDTPDLPSSINNGTTTAAIDILGTFGAAAYKGKIVSGTNCNSGTTWDLLPENTLATPLTATGLTSGTWTACAIGKSSSGLYWQGGYAGGTTVTVVTKYSWVIDTTPPTTVINWNSPITTPTTTTQTAGYDLQISTNDGATQYQWALVTGVGTPCTSATYSALVSIDTAITLNPPDIATTGVSTYKLCVLGRDAAGNTQTTATQTAEWTVDVEAPANNPSFAAISQAAQSFNTGVISFQIDNSTATADTLYYRIEVYKDSGLTQQIANTIVKSCKFISAPECPVALGTKTFSTAVDPFVAPQAYARIQAGDSLGNYRTDYSATSGEHYVVGKITGTVEDQSGAPLTGKTVRILDTNGTDLSAQYPAQTTAGVTAAYTFDNVRTSKLRYQIRVDEDGTHYAATRRSVTAQEKGTLGTIQTNVGITNVVTKAGASAQTLSVKVVDADDGWMLGYADVSLIDYTGATVATARSEWAGVNCTRVTPSGAPPTNIPKAKFDDVSTCGDVAFAGVNPGTYTVQVNGLSWNSGNQTYNNLNVENAAVFNAAVSKGRIPLVRTLTGQDMKIVLSWGALNPRDLDMHLVGTLPAGQAVTNINGDTCNTTQMHVWAARPNVGFSWQQQYSAKSRTYIQGNAAYAGQNFFPTDPSTTSALVQDAITGFGPEAINMITGYTDGTYWVSVVNWGEWYPGSYGVTKADQQWDVTQIGFKVYDADGLAFEQNAGAPLTAPTQLAPAVAVAGCQSTADYAQCEYWQAFKFTIAGSGSAGRSFTPVNTYQNWPDASGASVHDLNKCTLVNGW